MNTTTQIKMLEEWTPDQFKAIERAIYKHLKHYSTNEGIKYAGNYNDLDSVLGLAYTSSSKCAMYSICNGITVYSKYPDYHYEFFTIGEDGKFYANLWDKNENEITIEL